MTINYKIIEHIDNQENILLELDNTNITFSNISPIEHSQEIFILDNQVLTREELSDYSGSFIFLEQEDITEESTALLDQLFEILLSCEKEESIISIQTQVVNEENVIVTNFTQILQPSQIALVSKNLKIDTTLNMMIHRLCMAYKKVN